MGRSANILKNSRIFPKTAGANGLVTSLTLRFKISFIFAGYGEVKIDLLPKALGPNSILPLNQPTIFCFFNKSETLHK